LTQKLYNSATTDYGYWFAQHSRHAESTGSAPDEKYLTVFKAFSAVQQIIINYRNFNQFQASRYQYH
jgi:hypothetical protein